MNYLDLLFLVLTGFSILYSLIRGLVREIFALLSILLGFLGASYGFAPVSNWLKGWVENPILSRILGFALIFVILSLAIILLGRALSRAVKKTGLRWADRLGGGAFGLIKAILLVSIILLVLTAFLPSNSKLLSESKVSPSILPVSRGLSWLALEKLGGLYADKERDLKRFWSAMELTGEMKETKGGKN